MPVPAVVAESGLRLINVEFDRIEPEGDDLLRSFGVGCRLKAFAGMAIAIEADRVAKLAAKPLVDRHAERFPRQIPECDLDPGHRGDRRSRHRAVEQASPAHLFEKTIDIE